MGFVIVENADSVARTARNKNVFGILRAGSRLTRGSFAVKKRAGQAIVHNTYRSIICRKSCVDSFAVSPSDAWRVALPRNLVRITISSEEGEQGLRRSTTLHLRGAVFPGTILVICRRYATLQAP
jgi:hypothetical protein